MKIANTAERSGMGLSSVLLVVFIVLKLTDNIDWSWVWVLSPLWIPISLVLTVLVVFSVFWFVAALAGAKFRVRVKKE